MASRPSAQRILLINHYAGGPRYGMEFRPHYLSRAWVDSGHAVTVLGASHSHLRRVNPPQKFPWASETIDGVDYRWLPTPAYAGSGLARIANMLAFVMQLFLVGWWFAIRLRPTVVVASSTYPIDIFPAWLMARLSGARLVFEVHDLWPLSPMELGGYSSWHPFIVAMGLGESFAYRCSDAVVSILPKALDHMVLRGMKPEKFSHIPNGIWLKEWDSQVPAPEQHICAVEALRRRYSFVAGYLGGHSVSNALETILDAAPALAQRGIGVVFVGDGKDKAALEARAKEMNLDNCLFLPAVPKAAVPATLALFDALYLGFRRLPLYRFGVGPNKLLDYMMAARPIVFGIEAGNDLVAEASCGISIAPEDPSLIVDALARPQALSPSAHQKLGESGRSFAINNHAYDVLAERFLAAVTADFRSH